MVGGVGHLELQEEGGRASERSFDSQVLVWPHRSRVQDQHGENGEKAGNEAEGRQRRAEASEGG